MTLTVVPQILKLKRDKLSPDGLHHTGDVINWLNSYQEHYIMTLYKNHLIVIATHCIATGIK